MSRHLTLHALLHALFCGECATIFANRHSTHFVADDFLNHKTFHASGCHAQRKTY